MLATVDRKRIPRHHVSRCGRVVQLRQQARDIRSRTPSPAMHCESYASANAPDRFARIALSKRGAPICATSSIASDSRADMDARVGGHWRERPGRARLRRAFRPSARRQRRRDHQFRPRAGADLRHADPESPGDRAVEDPRQNRPDVEPRAGAGRRAGRDRIGMHLHRAITLE